MKGQENLKNFIMKGFTIFILQLLMSGIRYSSACIVTGYRLDCSLYSDRLQARLQGCNTSQSRKLLCAPQLPDSHWVTKPSIQWVSEYEFLGVKQPVRKAEHTHAHLVQRSRIMELY
jgi:hypothetical protein